MAPKGFEKVRHGTFKGLLNELRQLLPFDGTTTTISTPVSVTGALAATGNITSSGGTVSSSVGVLGGALVASATPSAASEVDFTLGTLPLYRVTGWLLPASDATLQVRIGVSGTIQSGAADYAWRILTTAGGTALDLSDSEIQLSGGGTVESTAASGGAQIDISIVNPSQTTIRKRIKADTTLTNGAGDIAITYICSGSYIGALSAVDTIRIFFPSVNIASGELQLWGYGS